MRSALLVPSLALWLPAVAHAGGFETPDNGAEAMGRGGAFTAKADDPTALVHNVAGLAQQRGTRVALDANVWSSTSTFQRAGVYPDSPSDPRTPWGGRPFPLVANRSAPFLAPMLAATTDLGRFDRVTFGAGVFGPSSPGTRTFPLVVGGAPSPARYDFVQSDSIIAFPTLAVAARLTDAIDLGVALQAAYGAFDVTSVSTTDLSRVACPNVEYAPCDSPSRLKATALGYAAQLGVLARPAAGLVLGAQLRTPITLDASGTIDATSPRAAPAPSVPGTVRLVVRLPAVLRVGMRLVFADAGFETGDLEIDGTYEAWSRAQGDGVTADVPQLNGLKDIHTLTIHHYRDTVSVRVGGAYNVRALGGVLSLRAGAYVDSSATSAPDTRVDIDTLAKTAATLGIGLAVGRFTWSLAYAEIFSASRTVEGGKIRPLNGAQHGSSVDGSGALLPAVNDGVYAAHARVVSLGASVRFGGK